MKTRRTVRFVAASIFGLSIFLSACGDGEPVKSKSDSPSNPSASRELTVTKLDSLTAPQRNKFNQIPGFMVSSFDSATISYNVDGSVDIVALVPTDGCLPDNVSAARTVEGNFEVVILSYERERSLCTEPYIENYYKIDGFKFESVGNSGVEEGEEASDDSSSKNSDGTRAPTALPSAVDGGPDDPTDSSKLQSVVIKFKETGLNAGGKGKNIVNEREVPTAFHLNYLDPYGGQG